MDRHGKDNGVQPREEMRFKTQRERKMIYCLNLCIPLSCVFVSVAACICIKLAHYLATPKPMERTHMKVLRVFVHVQDVFEQRGGGKK